jgi:hypothetical protein
MEDSSNVPQSRTQVDYMVDKTKVIAPYYINEGLEFGHYIEEFHDTILQWSIYRDMEIRPLESYLENLKDKEEPSFWQMTKHQFEHVPIPPSVQRSLDNGCFYNVNEMMQFLLGDDLSAITSLKLPVDQGDLHFFNTCTVSFTTFVNVLSTILLLAKMRRINDNQKLIQEFYEALECSMVSVFTDYQVILSMYQIIADIRDFDLNIGLEKVVEFFINSVTIDKFDYMFNKMNPREILDNIDGNERAFNFYIAKSWREGCFPF